MVGGEHSLKISGPQLVYIMYIYFFSISYETCDKGHVIHDTRYMVGGEHCLKISGPKFVSFGSYDV